AAIRPPRIGVVRNFLPELTEPVMQDAIERSAERMKAAGARVVDAFLPDEFQIVWALHRIVGGVEGAALHSRRYADDPGIVLSARYAAMSLLPATYYLHAQRIRHQIWTLVQ